MSRRQATVYEKALFEIVKEYNNKFYYDSLFEVMDFDEYKITVEKQRGEITGRAYVVFQNGGNLEYEIRYNSIMNLNEGYTLLVPGVKAG